MRFLVIDDSLPMRRIVTNILGRLGHTDVVLAANGREGLQRLEAEPVDFVITDWYMPHMNGLAFAKEMREREAMRDIPILFVTANGSKDDVKQAAQLGINGYVLKPFTAESLKERIGAILALRGQPLMETPAPAAAGPLAEPLPQAG